MWTESLIELFGAAHAPQGWTCCSTCKMEYSKPIMAYRCWKGHRAVHERVYANIDTEVKKHEVAFNGNQPLCRSCVKQAAKEASAEVSLTVVQMAEPPVCTKCHKPIQDPPFVELMPQRLPLSERHRDLILNPGRDSLVAIQDHRIHKGLREWSPEVGSEEIDPRLIHQFGPVVPDGKGGLPRTAGGYLEVGPAKEPVPCNILASYGTQTSEELDSSE